MCIHLTYIKRMSLLSCVSLRTNEQFEWLPMFTKISIDNISK